MNCFERLAKDFKRKQRKRKVNPIKSIAAFTVLGIVIGGAITVFFAEKCYEEIENIVTKNHKGSLKDININSDESIGDIDIEMKMALEDLEE